MLADFLDTGLAAELDIWHEWEQGAKGMRRLCWSKGLKARVGVGEKTDEEIAAEVLDAAPVLVLPAQTWQRKCHDPTALVDAAEQSRQAACGWLEDRGPPLEKVEHLIPRGLNVAALVAQVEPNALRRLAELGR